jgi:hypothetical protein
VHGPDSDVRLSSHSLFQFFNNSKEGGFSGGLIEELVVKHFLLIGNGVEGVPSEIKL